MPFKRMTNKNFQSFAKQIEDIRNSKRDGSLSIFQGLLDSKLSESEKETERLCSESRVFVAAGTETTASMLSMITFHLLENPDILKKPKSELEIAIPDMSIKPAASQVENLPYLVSQNLKMADRLRSDKSQECYNTGNSPTSSTSKHAPGKIRTR